MFAIRQYPHTHHDWYQYEKANNQDFAKNSPSRFVAIRLPFLLGYPLTEPKPKNQLAPDKLEGRRAQNDDNCYSTLSIHPPQFCNLPKLFTTDGQRFYALILPPVKSFF